MLSEMISLLCGLLAALIADRYRYNTFLECKSRLADDIPYIILTGNLLVYLISNSRSSAISLLFIINFFLMVVSDLHEQSFDTCLLVVPLATADAFFPGIKHGRPGAGCNFSGSPGLARFYRENGQRGRLAFFYSCL